MEIYTVAQITRYLKELFDSDYLLQNLWVQGEVSNFIRSAAGHVYFTLKDNNSQIRCVMFRGQAARRGREDRLASGDNFMPSNGMAVIVHGRLSIYDVQGVYQLYADLIRPEGVGLLHLQFEELRARLEREGLFHEARKRPLPRFPRRIGVVTSPTGAVLHDIITVITRRFPFIDLVLAPSLVQGDGAADEICQAIEALNEFAEVDLIILARGGGSIEELWPFNEEKVARAIYGSRVPVITGIGHETDFTIADWVADCRAPTPSVAAELAVPNQHECQMQLDALRNRLLQTAQARVDARRSECRHLVEGLARTSPIALLQRQKQRVDDLSRWMDVQVRHYLDLEREKLRSLAAQLESLSPHKTLARGYSVCRRAADGKVVSSVSQVADGDELVIRVYDGEFQGEVISI